jgi:hypothetical protein
VHTARRAASLLERSSPHLRHRPCPPFSDFIADVWLGIRNDARLPLILPTALHDLHRLVARTGLHGFHRLARTHGLHGLPGLPRFEVVVHAGRVGFRCWLLHGLLHSFGRHGQRKQVVSGYHARCWSLPNFVQEMATEGVCLFACVCLCVWVWTPGSGPIGYWVGACRWTTGGLQVSPQHGVTL